MTGFTLVPDISHAESNYARNSICRFKRDAVVRDRVSLDRSVARAGSRVLDGVGHLEEIAGPCDVDLMSPVILTISVVLVMAGLGLLAHVLVAK